MISFKLHVSNDLSPGRSFKGAALMKLLVLAGKGRLSNAVQKWLCDEDRRVEDLQRGQGCAEKAQSKGTAASCGKLHKGGREEAENNGAFLSPPSPFSLIHPLLAHSSSV